MVASNIFLSLISQNLPRKLIICMEQKEENILICGESVKFFLDVEV